MAGFSAQDLESSVSLAVELAEAARAPALRHFRATSLGVDNKRAAEGGFDPVTAADRDVEAAIRAILSRERPEDAVVGEEQADSPGGSGISWVIDPIDGTRSFLCGLPTWGVLIAMNDGQRPVIGVMDQPFTRERYLGVVGGETPTAYVDEGDTRVALRTRRGVALKGALALTTAMEAFASDEDRAVFEALAPHLRLVRFGTDCYGYAMLARGQIDLVVESGLCPYDIQAMIPIVQAAGGVITDWHGGDCQQGGRVVAAGDEALHAEAVAFLSARV